MEETEARKLVAFSVLTYNLAGAIALYFSYNHVVLNDFYPIFTIVAFTMPITILGNFYMDYYPDSWYPLVFIQIVILCITLYLADATVRYIQR